VLSDLAVEKHVNAIFSKLKLSEEPQLHRCVAAVLAYLRDSGRQGRRRTGTLGLVFALAYDRGPRPASRARMAA
jgi:hypothetical protein